MVALVGHGDGGFGVLGSMWISLGSPENRANRIGIDRGCFWIGFIFELVDWTKQSAFPSAGGPHLIHWKPE